jgi:UDPglucose 6-dehydrogenase
MKHLEIPMKILIIGTGYVGLVTGACFAENGHEVICLDINHDKIEKLQKGIIPIFEPDLEKLVKKGIENKKLSFTSNYSDVENFSEIAFICTPTPSLESGKADLSYIMSACYSLALCVKQEVTLVIKSTVPPATADEVDKNISSFLKKEQLEKKIKVVSNPEFLREGSAVFDCLHPERIIIGIQADEQKKLFTSIYEKFIQKSDQILFMDRRSAELTKYAANAMLATRISFMNELSNICEKIGANIENIKKGIGSDSRIGPHFLCAGIGFGGSCFPKDIKALRAQAAELSIETPILNAVESINEKQKKLLSQKIQKYFLEKGGVKGKTIAIWGLSFKPNTDDIREAPSLTLIKELQQLGAKIKAFDPVAIENVKNLIDDSTNISWCKSEYDACVDAEAVALVTEWKQFSELDLEKTLKQMSGRAFFDGRNLYCKKEMTEKGFEYFGVGIPHDGL